MPTGEISQKMYKPFMQKCIKFKLVGKENMFLNEKTQNSKDYRF